MRTDAKLLQETDTQAKETVNGRRGEEEEGQAQYADYVGIMLVFAQTFFVSSSSSFEL